VFNEDFSSLVVQGPDAWATVSDYVAGVAPDLAGRVSKYTGTGDLFADLRVDEQLMKALDRKVWLPSGGSLVIDRTEAMTVIDVNTGKFVGAGGNLEQTVTRNNLEAAEEIVRQLRLRDVGGIVVIDFIDMVLESNRELVLRRLTECLGRDRTKHQVAEVTSLGLVQMTRKRVGEGLLEAFSEVCDCCKGRGVIIHTDPVDSPATAAPEEEDRGKSRKRRGKRAEAAEPAESDPQAAEQRAKALEAMAAVHRAAATEDESADVPDLDSLPDAEDDTALAAELAEAEPVDEAPADLAAVNGSPAAVEPAPAETPRRPRRRRAATRPAGPPRPVEAGGE
jgi:ribonuclease E